VTSLQSKYLLQAIDWRGGQMTGSSIATQFILPAYRFGSTAAETVQVKTNGSLRCLTPGKYPLQASVVSTATTFYENNGGGPEGILNLERRYRWAMRCRMAVTEQSAGCGEGPQVNHHRQIQPALIRT
jgi:hypothetical protein